MSLALAAYNAGEGAVTAHANRVPPYIETRDYVRLVRAVYAIYRPATAARGRLRVTAPRAPRPSDYVDVASE